MGSILYDFLSESVLFSEVHSEGGYSALSDEELVKEIDRYREFCISNMSDLLVDIPDSQRRLRLYGGSEFQNLNRLKQAALYLDCMVVPDPLFQLTHRPSEVSKAFSGYLGMPQRPKVDRENVVRAIKMMQEAKPMIASNFLKFIPSSLYLEPPSLPQMRYSPVQFADSMPATLLDLYRKSVEVRSMIKQEKGWAISNEFQVGRGIAIRFKRDVPHHFDCFNYFEQQILSYDEANGKFTAALSLPESPPSQVEFDLWVNQSINSSAVGHLRRLETELGVAAACGAMYATPSTFSAEVLGETLSEESTIPSDTTDLLLDLELSILENISIDALMRVRDQDGAAFDLFRRELERQLREVRLESDPARQKLKLQNAVHELTEVKMTDVDQAIARIKKRALAEVSVATATLGASVATSGASLFGTLIAAANGYKTFRDYQEKVRTNPAYFLWRVTKN